MAFTKNLDGSAQLSVFITSLVPANGSVQIPSLGFSQAFSLPGGTLVSISLPLTAMLALGFPGPDELTADLAVHVSSDAPVTVYGLNRAGAITDAYLALPQEALGTSYTVLSYGNSISSGGSTLFAVTAGQNSTQVTIIPSAASGGHPAGIPYSITLNQGQAYQLKIDSSMNPNADFTGTLISSDKPVGVFAGHSCVNIPGDIYACDLLLEQVFPSDGWGTQYIALPFLTRVYDVLRIHSQAAGTQLSLDGVPVATLAANTFYQCTVSASTVITSDKPVLVGQYSVGANVDAAMGDPSLLYLPPNEQFLSDYIISTPPSGFGNNYVNLVVPNSAVGAVTLDGVPVPAGSYSPVPGTVFSGARLPVGVGVHTLSGPQPFGVSVYGFANYNAYGYTGGLGLASVATVASLTLTPKTAALLVGQTHCVSATVSTSALSPVAGVRVDFAVSGAHASMGSSYTNALGQALYCYAGSATGIDAISARVGLLSDTASCDWSLYTPTITPTHSVSPTFSVTPSFSVTQTFSLTPTFSETPTPSHTPSITLTTTPTPPDLILHLPPPSPNPSLGDLIWLPWFISTPAEVDIEIFSVAGESVRRLDPAWVGAGYSERAWDLLNDSGQKTASGVYIYRVRAKSARGEIQKDFSKCAVLR